jgi:hypothetical protein
LTWRYPSLQNRSAPHHKNNAKEEIPLGGDTVKRIAFTALVACALSAANAALAVIVVYPTGDYPTDVQNVQAAVDQSGTVLLKAQNAAGVATTFNFGPPVEGPGFVTL